MLYYYHLGYFPNESLSEFMSIMFFSEKLVWNLSHTNFKRRCDLGLSLMFRIYSSSHLLAFLVILKLLFFNLPPYCR